MAKTKLLSLMEVGKLMNNFLGRKEVESTISSEKKVFISSLLFNLQKAEDKQEVIHLLLDATEEEISFMISFQETEKVLTKNQEKLFYSSIDIMNKNTIDIVEKDFEIHNIVFLCEKKKNEMLKQARVYQALGLKKENAIGCSLYDNKILFS